jgi:hypothetical protein
MLGRDLSAVERVLSSGSILRTADLRKRRSNAQRHHQERVACGAAGAGSGNPDGEAAVAAKRAQGTRQLRPVVQHLSRRSA